MEKVIKNKLTNKEIVEIAFDALSGCYGILGVCAKDVNKINILTKEHADKGIFVHNLVNGTFSLSIYIVLASDVKISEAIREAQKTTRYLLNKKSNNSCKAVDVYALAVN